MDSKNAIREAFFRLASNHPYASVSVESICAEAAVSRKTFSRYFYDKEEIVQSQIYEDFINPTLQVSAALNLNEMKSIGGLLVESDLQRLFDHRAYYMSAIAAIGTMRFVEMVVNLRVKYLTPITSSQGFASSEYYQYWASSVHAMTFKWWLEHDFQPSIKEMVRMESGLTGAYEQQRWHEKD